MSSMYVFEVCANSIESCIAAQAAGAHRIQLCAAFPEGGTTPSYGFIRLAANLLSGVSLQVMIRPRSGDFCYTEYDMLQMEMDIGICAELGIDGVALGCLNRHGHVDRAAMQRLLAKCQGMQVTFHRAFDVCCDPFEALEDLIELGVHRVITSGQQNNALQGAELIGRLDQAAAGRITVMAGAGINAGNIREIAAKAGVREYHFSGKGVEPSVMSYKKEGVLIAADACIDEYSRTISLPHNIENTINALTAAAP